MSRVQVCAGLAAVLGACAVVSGVAATNAGRTSVTAGTGGDTSVWTETTVCTAGCGGTYTGTYTLSSSTLSGKLVSGGQTFTVTTTRHGASFTMHTTGAGYASDAKGTVSADGKGLSGTFSDGPGGSGTWTAKLISGPPATTVPVGATTTTTTTTTTPTSSCSTRSTQGGPSVLNVTSQPMKQGTGVILNLHGASASATLGFDLNADGHPDYVGPGSLTSVGIVSPTTLNRTITVTASCPSGLLAATDSIKVLVPGDGLPPKFAPTTVTFASGDGLFTDLAQLNCTNSTVVFDLIDARGCFKVYTSPNVVPAAERATANTYYGTSILPAYLAAEQPCKNATCTALTKIFTKDYKVYGSTGGIKVNGLTIRPARGHEVIVDPNALRIFSSDATVSLDTALGSAPLKSGQVDLDFTDRFFHSGRKPDGTYPDGETPPILTFDARKGIPLIGGFPVNAGAELAFANKDGVRKSRITVHVELPKTFGVFGDGPQPSAAGTGVITNDAPFEVDSLDFAIPHASIAGIGFDDLAFHYAAHGDTPTPPEVPVCPNKPYWHATAKITLAPGPNGEPGTGFRLDPPPSLNGIAFCDGDFQSAGGELTFGVQFPAPQIFPSVFLTKVNFGIMLKPTLLIRGGATLSTAKLFEVSGTLLALFATRSAPYTLTEFDAGKELQDLAPRTFTNTVFMVGGNLKLDVPDLGTLDVAHGGLMYSYPDYIYAKAQVDVQLGIYVFTGKLEAWINAASRQFEADLDATIKVRGYDLSGGGNAIVSSNGVLACLTAKAFGVTIHPGVGLRPGHLPDVWLTGCDPTDYQVSGVGKRLKRSTGTRSFQVEPGEVTKDVKITGVGGAPKVIVQGPGGERLTIDGTSLQVKGPLIGLRSDTYRTTSVGIVHGTPGRYTITLMPGSVPFAKLYTTHRGPGSAVSGSVTQQSSGLTLRYDAGNRGGGRQVVFYEDGTNVRHELGSSSGGKGTLRFTPAPGAAGERTIVARANVGGIPVPGQVIAHFHFAGTTPAGKPGKVTVQRKGTTLIVSWGPAAGAVSYGIVVNRSSGVQQVLQVSAKHPTVRITRFPTTDGGTVSINARGALGDWGPARASAPFKAVTAPASIFRSPRH